MVAELQMLWNVELESGVRATIYAVTSCAVLFGITRSAGHISDRLTVVLMVAPALINWYLRQAQAAEIVALLILASLSIPMALPRDCRVSKLFQPFWTVQSALLVTAEPEVNGYPDEKTAVFQV